MNDRIQRRWLTDAAFHARVTACAQDVAREHDRERDHADRRQIQAVAFNAAVTAILEWESLAEPARPQ